MADELRAVRGDGTGTRVRSTGLRRWLASGDASLARAARRGLRAFKRTEARIRSGSVAAEMDRIVEQAPSGVHGSALSARTNEQKRKRTRNQAERRLMASSGPEGRSEG